MPCSAKKTSARRQNAAAVTACSLASTSSRRAGSNRRWRCGRRRSRHVLSVLGRSSPAVSPPAPSLGDAAQLLDVDVDELARAVHLVAADRGPRHLVEVVEPVQPVAHQHPVHRRRLQAADAGDARRPQARFWRSVTTRRSIEALVLVGHRFGRDERSSSPAGPSSDSGATRRRPGPSRSPWPLPHGPPAAAFDPLAQEQSTLWGQASVTVHPKPPW